MCSRLTNTILPGVCFRIRTNVNLNNIQLITHLTINIILFRNIYRIWKKIIFIYGAHTQSIAVYYYNVCKDFGRKQVEADVVFQLKQNICSNVWDRSEGLLMFDTGRRVLIKDGQKPEPCLKVDITWERFPSEEQRWEDEGFIHKSCEISNPTLSSFARVMAGHIASKEGSIPSLWIELIFVRSNVQPIRIRMSNGAVL